MTFKPIFLFVGLVFLLSLACNFPVATGAEKMKPVRLTTTADRISFSGVYSCNAEDSVILIVDQNGIATLSVTGIVYVDYINCKPDPSGFKATYIISGIADPDLKLATFSSCNDGGFSAEGEIIYRDDKPIGHVSCSHNKGEQAGEPAVTVWVPAGK